VVRVLPDVAALDRAFDYLVPPSWDAQVRVGSRVRVALGPRRVAGWVIADNVEPAPGLELRPLASLCGWGPSAELVELAGWAAWRWAGRRVHFLGTASPQGVVRDLPAPGAGVRRPGWVPTPVGPLVAEALTSGAAVVRVAPAVDLLGLVEALLTSLLGPERSVIVLCPSVAGAQGLASRLVARGWPVALLSGGWAAAAAGGRVVLGVRAGAWGPAPALAGIVVLDAHDQGYESEAAPTWVAWRVAAERARRAGVPCVLVSSCPTLEMLAWGSLHAASRGAERQGWAALELVDMRTEDPRRGLYSERLVAMLAMATPEPGGQVVCVLNRTGRSRLLACYACGELARCEHCGGVMAQHSGVGAEVAARRLNSSNTDSSNTDSSNTDSSNTDSSDTGALVCRSCGSVRPVLCARCGSGRMKTLRVGVTRVREELSALSGLGVEEVSGRTGATSECRTPVLVGTEAVLHRLGSARVVAFLDIDQELFAPRFRAGEDALGLLARASRLVGGRLTGGRVLVQTRVRGHEVLEAALHADPGRVTGAEMERRTLLRLPPVSALALVSGAGAESYVGRLSQLGAPGLEVRGPDRDAWLVRAPDHGALCDSLAAVARPRGRLRVQVDPRRV
jgi:primosomal protein N' (replication factor Y)